MIEECAQIGAKALAKFLSIPLDTVKRRLIPHMKEIGIVIEWTMERPPRKRLLWFPSMVMRYMGLMQVEKWKKDHPEAK